MKSSIRIFLAVSTASITLYGGWVEQMHIMQGSGDDNLSFGRSMDVDGDYAVIGAPDEDGYATDDGAVYVYKHEPNDTVTQLSKISGYFKEKLGTDVAVKSCGTHLFIAAGAPEYTFYNAKTGRTTYEDHILLYDLNISDNSLNLFRVFNDANGTGLGKSVDLACLSECSFHPQIHCTAKGLIMAAGEENIDKVHTFIYNFVDENWTDLELSGENAGDRFGHSVAMSSKLDLYVNANAARLIIGAPDIDGTGHVKRGAAYLYQFSGSDASDYTWGNQHILRRDDSGLLLQGTHFNNYTRFGMSVDLTIDHAIVGALKESVSSDNVIVSPGEAVIYVLTNANQNAWDRESILPANSLGANLYGSSVAISDHMALVGAPMNFNRGAAYLYEYNSSTSIWSYSETLSNDRNGSNGTSVDFIQGKPMSGDPKNDVVTVYDFVEPINTNPALLMYLLN